MKSTLVRNSADARKRPAVFKLKVFIICRYDAMAAIPTTVIGDLSRWSCVVTANIC